MNVNVDTLRELQSQTYNPRSVEPAATPYETYRTKAFGGQHLSECYHENTKNVAHDRFRLDRSITYFLTDDSVAFAVSNIDPEYDGRPLVDLPPPSSLDCSLSDALGARRSVQQYDGTGLSPSTLSTLLGHSFGTTGTSVMGRDADGDPVEKSVRAYPSAGGLYPVEQYVAVVNGRDGLDPGWYHYTPGRHGLRRLGVDDGPVADRLDELFITADSMDLQSAGAVVFLTAAFWRSRAKYGERGYRHVLMEAGYAGQNLLLAATGLGLGAVHVDGFVDRAVEQTLGIDGVDESVLSSIVIGSPRVANR